MVENRQDCWARIGQQTDHADMEGNFYCIYYDIVGMYLTYAYRSITNAFYSRRVANQYHIYI